MKLSIQLNQHKGVQNLWQNLSGSEQFHDMVAKPFHVTSPSLYPLVISENFGFLVFSRGIEREHWPEMC